MAISYGLFHVAATYEDLTKYLPEKLLNLEEGVEYHLY